MHIKMTELIETIENMIPVIRDLFLDNVVVIAVAAFLLVMVMLGYRRGLMTRIISLSSVLLTLIAEVKLYPVLLDTVNGSGKWQKFFRDFGSSLLFDHTERQYSPLYERIGLDVLAENAGELIGEVAVKVLLFLVLFAVIRLALRAVSLLIQGLRKFSLIRWLDSWLGAALGIVEGLIYVWLAMFLLAGFPNFVYTRMIMDQIMHNRFLFVLYNENLITRLVAGLLR